MLANYYFSAKKDFAFAARYFARSGIEIVALNAAATLLKAWTEFVPPVEQDLIVARLVLLYLCSGNLKGANFVFATTTLNTPLAHFIKFLLLTCERRAGPLFTMLRNKYSAHLSRDAAFTAYLDRIGKQFFDLKPVSNNLSSILTDMFTSE